MRGVTTVFLTSVVILWACAANVGLADTAIDFADDFSDGSVNPTYWVTGTGWRGEYDAWSHAVTEGGNSMQLKVAGPATGNSCAGEAWVRTTFNYNDGKAHTIDFTWEPKISDNHVNMFQISVTDGYITPRVGGASNENFYWLLYPRAGTTDLLWGGMPQGQPEMPVWWLATEETPAAVNPGMLNWSVTIDPSGVARLYDAPGATGNMRREGQLDASDAWYLRFLVEDGSSSGFGPGASELNLYSIHSESETVPEPSSIALFLIGAISLIGFAWQRRAS